MRAEGSHRTHRSWRSVDGPLADPRCRDADPGVACSSDGPGRAGPAAIGDHRRRLAGWVVLGESGHGITFGAVVRFWTRSKHARWRSYVHQGCARAVFPPWCTCWCRDWSAASSPTKTPPAQQDPDAFRQSITKGCRCAARGPTSIRMDRGREHEDHPRESARQPGYRLRRALPWQPPSHERHRRRGRR